jgi:hypothetical protein
MRHRLANAFEDHIKSPDLCAAQIVKIELPKFTVDKPPTGEVSTVKNSEI